MRFLSKKFRARLWGGRKGESAPTPSLKKNLDTELEAILLNLSESSKQEIIERYGKNSSPGEFNQISRSLEPSKQRRYTSPILSFPTSNKNKEKALKFLESSDDNDDLDDITPGSSNSNNHRPALGRPDSGAFIHTSAFDEDEDEDEVLDLIEQLKDEVPVPSIGSILQLKLLLAETSEHSVIVFQDNGGLELIGDALGTIAVARVAAEAAASIGDYKVGADASSKAFKDHIQGGSHGVDEDGALEIEVELVHCLMLLLNIGDKASVNFISDDDELLQVVATVGTTSPSPFVCGSMMRLMTVVAGSNFEGREKVLKAFDHIRLERDDSCRFVTLCDTIGDEQAGISIKVDTMVLINTLLPSDDIEDRVLLRHEMVEAGILEALHLVRELYSQKYVESRYYEETDIVDLDNSSKGDSSRERNSSHDSLSFQQDDDDEDTRTLKDELAAQIELFENWMRQDHGGQVIENVPNSEASLLAHNVYSNLENNLPCQLHFVRILEELEKFSLNPEILYWSVARNAVVEAGDPNAKLLKKNPQLSTIPSTSSTEVTQKVPFAPSEPQAAAPLAPSLQNCSVLAVPKNIIPDNSIPLAPPLPGMSNNHNSIPPAPPLPGMPRSNIPIAPPLPGMPKSNIPLAPPLPGMLNNNIPIAPPLPGMPNNNIPPAPPLPGMLNNNIPIAPPLPGMPRSNIPIAPPLPGIPKSNIPIAPPLPGMPKSNIPPAPPLPGMPSNIPLAPPLPGMPNNNIPPAPPLPGMPRGNIPPAPPMPGMPRGNIPPPPPMPGMPMGNIPPPPPMPGMPRGNIPPPPPMPGMPMGNIPLPPPMPGMPRGNIPPPPPMPGMPRGNLPPPPPMPGMPRGNLPPPPPMPGGMPRGPALPGIPGGAMPPPPPILGLPRGAMPPPPGPGGMKNPPPPSGPVIARPKPPKRRSLFWDKVDDKAVPNTLFMNLQPASVELPLSILREAFEEKTKTNEEKEEEERKRKEKEEALKKAAAAKSNQKISLLDANTARNVGIVYKLFRMKPHEIANAVLSMDGNALNVDKVISLRSIAPTSEQIGTLKDYSGKLEDLDEITQFMVTVARIPRYSARLECTLFIRAFSGDVKHLYERVDMVIMAIKEAKTSLKLRRLLELVLAMGNFLNEGTRNGNARGIRLNSLLKLETVKSLDKKKTFLHVLAAWANEKEAYILDLDEDLEHCREAGLWSLTDLKSEIGAMRTGLNQVQSQLKASEMEKNKPPEDHFSEVATEFLAHALGSMQALEDLHEKAMSDYQMVASMFGEDSNSVPSGEFFNLMNDFVLMLSRAVKENRQREIIEEKKRRSEEKAAKAKHEKELRETGQKVDGISTNINPFAENHENDLINTEFMKIKTNILIEGAIMPGKTVENPRPVPIRGTSTLRAPSVRGGRGEGMYGTGIPMKSIRTGAPGGMYGGGGPMMSVRGGMGNMQRQRSTARVGLSHQRSTLTHQRSTLRTQNSIVMDTIPAAASSRPNTLNRLKSIAFHGNAR